MRRMLPIPGERFSVQGKDVPQNDATNYTLVCAPELVYLIRSAMKSFE